MLVALRCCGAFYVAVCSQGSWLSILPRRPLVGTLDADMAYDKVVAEEAPEVHRDHQAHQALPLLRLVAHPPPWLPSLLLSEYGNANDRDELNAACQSAWHTACKAGRAEELPRFAAVSVIVNDVMHGICVLTS